MKVDAEVERLLPRWGVSLVVDRWLVMKKGRGSGNSGWPH